jgi:hypothetical protein
MEKAKTFQDSLTKIKGQNMTGTTESTRKISEHREGQACV